ncbi:MAG: hypothetical protein JNM69_37580 [Archangium sp.]|nr:hypothetical protein [Archangium sp.]
MTLSMLVLMSVLAETADEAALAKRFFEEGRAHAKAGRAEAACEAYAGSLHYQRTLGVLLNLAVCSEQLERFHDVWRYADEAQVLAARTQDPRGALARTLQKRAERFVAFVQVNVDAPGELVVNGLTSLLGVPVTLVPVPLGFTEVLVRAPGRLSFVKSATLGPGQVWSLEPWPRELSATAAAGYAWFTPAAVPTLKVAVLGVDGGFPYFGVPANGCTGGARYVRAVLDESVDGMSAGTHVVVRTTMSPTAGTRRTFEGLRRAGLGRDGTPVFCDVDS